LRIWNLGTENIKSEILNLQPKFCDMQYTVLLHRYSTGVYEAVIPAVPGCAGKGKTRSEALNQLKNTLQDWLHTTEITTIEVDSSQSEQPPKLNPWLATAGMFEADPMLESMLKEIYALREITEPLE